MEICEIKLWPFSFFEKAFDKGAWRHGIRTGGQTQNYNKCASVIIAIFHALASQEERYFRGQMFNVVEL